MFKTIRQRLKSVLAAAEMGRVTRTFGSAPAVTGGYIICTYPRSGSTLLCEVLARTGRLGFPGEWLLPNAPSELARHIKTVPDYEAPGYVAQLARCTATPNGIFALKVMWPEFDHLINANRWGPDALGAGFQGGNGLPAIKYLHLVRRDRLGQAVSKLLAERSGVWHAFGMQGSFDASARDKNVTAILADPVQRKDVLDRLDEIIAFNEDCEGKWAAFLPRPASSRCSFAMKTLRRICRGRRGRSWR